VAWAARFLPLTEQRNLVSVSKFRGGVLFCIALDGHCEHVRTADSAAAIAAKRIIDRAKGGERNADRLCDDALEILRKRRRHNDPS
jgi:hypothetical protein